MPQSTHDAKAWWSDEMLEFLESYTSLHKLAQFQRSIFMSSSWFLSERHKRFEYFVIVSWCSLGNCDYVIQQDTVPRQRNDAAYKTRSLHWDLHTRTAKPIFFGRWLWSPQRCCQFACLCLVSWTLVRQQKVRLTKGQVVGPRHCGSRSVHKRMKLSLGNVKATLDRETGHRVLGYLVNAIGRRTHVLGSDIEFKICSHLASG